MLRNLMNRVHLAAQTEQVDGDNRPDSFSTSGFQFAARIGLAVFLNVFLNRGWGDVVRFRIDIHEERLGSGARDAASGCEECVRRGDDGVAASDAERHQNGQESVCPGRNTDSMRCVAITTDRFLERLHSRPRMKRWLARTPSIASR